VKGRWWDPGRSPCLTLAAVRCPLTIKVVGDDWLRIEITDADSPLGVEFKHLTAAAGPPLPLQSSTRPSMRVPPGRSSTMARWLLSKQHIGPQRTSSLLTARAKTAGLPIHRKAVSGWLREIPCHCHQIVSSSVRSEAGVIPGKTCPISRRHGFEGVQAKPGTCAEGRLSD